MRGEVCFRWSEPSTAIPCVTRKKNGGPGNRIDRAPTKYLTCVVVMTGSKEVVVRIGAVLVQVRDQHIVGHIVGALSLSLSLSLYVRFTESQKRFFRKPRIARYVNAMYCVVRGPFRS